jgi:hypothetical protein
MFRRKIFTIFILFLFTSIFLLSSCGKKSAEDLVIVTESYGLPVNSEGISNHPWKDKSQLRLVLINPKKKNKYGVILSEKFYSARSPEGSFDGNSIIFTGKLTKDDPWQIWEMKLRNRKARQITNSSDNSVDPAYLPGGRIVFSRLSANDSLKAGHSLFTCNPDGSDLRRITFNPHDYISSSVLKDGRVMTISRQLFPEQTGPVFMVLRPDGTKAELFYKSGTENEPKSRGWETSDGRIVFIESGNTGSSPGKLISIQYNRPLHSRKELASSDGGDFCFVCPAISGEMLVSYRAKITDHYALYKFEGSQMVLGNQIYGSPDGDVREAVVIQAHERPRKLPSEVDPGVKTGLLLCQNINVTGMTSPEPGFSPAHADHIEVLGINASLGKVRVRKDGSVYLKVAADMPFRIQTLDSLGNIVVGPGGWYYLRPNERRGCVGCHEDNEITPANRYADAVSKKPVVIPVHVDGVKEKEVELE